MMHALMLMLISTAGEPDSRTDSGLSVETGVQYGGARHQSENTVPADGRHRQTRSDGHQGFRQAGV